MSTKPSPTTLPKSPENKGKAKAKDVDMDVSMEREEEEEEEDDDEEEQEDGGEEMSEVEEEEEDFQEIDPSAIVSRRTRGIRVDYASKEALEKAGLTQEDLDRDEEADH